MNQETAIRRAQVYAFLAAAFLYPQENWSEEVELVAGIAGALDWTNVFLDMPRLSLPELQAAYRRTFGAAGSLGYETEYGLPHAYRQSQEMADIAGFYRAFGFSLGGKVRERPDHVAVELEFMHILALKEAYALDRESPEEAAVCVEAQGKFLQDHLGRWVHLFAQSVARSAPDSLYVALGQFAAAFVQADAGRLGVALDRPRLADVQHTPYDPDFSCATCQVPGLGQQGFVRAKAIR